MTVSIKTIEDEIKSHPSSSTYKKPDVKKYFDVGGKIYFEESYVDKSYFYPDFIDCGFGRTGWGRD